MIMLTCKEATRLVSEAQDRRLGWFERSLLGFHQLICRWCRHYARQIRFLTGVLRSNTARIAETPVARLDDAARNRIKENLKEL